MKAIICVVVSLTFAYGKRASEMSPAMIESHPLLSMNPYGTCNETTSCINNYYDCRDGACYHKGVFPIAGREWGGYFLVMILMSLCNVAGIGGGAID